MLWFSKKRPTQAAPINTSPNGLAVITAMVASANSKTLTLATTPTNSAALIERDAELAKLQAAWAAAREGQGALVLVAGEAGIGKSSLLQQFVKFVDEEHAPHKIARASCSAQTGRDEPFWPFADVMNQLVAAPAKPLAGDILDAVLDIAPSWVSIIPVAGDMVGAGLQTAKLVRERTKSSAGPNPDKLLREYVGALDSVSEKQPVLIVIDDLHWSDAGSVRLLSLLSRNVSHMPVMLVCAYRPSDVEVEGHPLRGLVSEIVRYNPDASIDLSPLTAQGVTALLAQKYPANKLPPDLGENIQGRTGGAPLFVLESLRLMQTRGEMKRDDADGKWMLTRELTDEDLPRSVEAVVNKRLERLPDELRRALALAAVQGTLFETEVLAYVMGRDEVDVMRMLEPAERPHDIIDYVGDVDVGDEVTSRYRFNSTLFQRELMQALRGKQRVMAHRKTAEGIEKSWRNETEEYAAQLAMHYERGRLWDKAAAYMIVAAQRARRVGETENGIKRFEQAELLLRKTTAGPSLEQQIEIDEGLSYLYDLDSRYDLSENRIRHALALNAMSRALDWRRSAMLKLRLANLTGDKGRHVEAMQMLSELYGELNRDHREHAGSIEAFRLRAALAFALTQMGKDDEGIQLAQESLNALKALPRGTQDRDEEEAWHTVEVELRSALAASYFGRGEYKQAIDIAEGVLRAAEKLDMLDTVLLVQDRLAEMHLAMGHNDKAFDYADQMEKTARDLSNESGLAMAHVVRARTLRLQDDNDGALRELDKAEALVKQFSWFADQPQMLAIRAAALIGLNRLDEAKALLDQADDVAATSGIAEWAAYVKFIRARLDFASRDFDAAADKAGDAARVFEQEWAYFEQGQALRLVAVAHKAAGNESAAQYAFKQALDIFERIGNTPQAEETRKFMN